MIFDKILSHDEDGNQDLKIVILDEARINKSKLTNNITQNIKFQIIFLPAYWSEIALVKLVFRVLKSKIITKLSKISHDFFKTFGIKQILATWSLIDDSKFNKVLQKSTECEWKLSCYYQSSKT